MSNYVIVTDSTIDLSRDMLKELNIEALPLSFNINGKEYLNSIESPEMQPDEFYNLLRNKANVKTSQVNLETYMTCFENHLEKGEDILYIALSSGISGTYNAAKVAAEELSSKYPKRKIEVIDSLLACMGEGFLVYFAVKKKNEGMPMEELINWININKMKVCSWFTVGDLFHLKNGGRISFATAMFGTMLGIKPIMHMDDTGHLIPMGKVRGRQNALLELVNKLKSKMINENNQTVFISHADCKDDALMMEKLIKKDKRVSKVYINDIGPVIGSHAGPGTVSLFFFGNER